IVLTALLPSLAASCGGAPPAAACPPSVPGPPLAASSVPAAQPRGRYANVHGLRMYYEVHGQGAPLVVLHGGSMSVSQWPEVVDFFSTRYQVIAPEQMGHGHTADDPSRPLHYHAMAEDTVELLRQLGVTSAYFVGWSDGG